MTKYEKIADQMVKDVKEIIKAKEENNGKTPYKWLKERYEIDGAAAGEIAIGVLAAYKHLEES